MSEIRYSLKALLPSLQKKIRTLKCEKAKSRYYFIRAVCRSTKSLKQACESRGKGTDYFYLWAQRLLKSGKVEALKDESKRPKNSPNKTPEWLEKKIKRMRQKESYLGPETISFYLKKRHDIHCPPSTVYRVLKRLNLIKAPYKTKKTSKHTKRYRRPFPGYLQMDIKYVPYLVTGQRFYQLSAVDHCSSWRYMEVLERRTDDDIIGFLNRLEQVCPFEIIQLQTDNAMEFTDRFTSFGNAPSGNHKLDRWCHKRGIEHKLIPVGEKEINGKVENTHRFDEREFYQRFDFRNLIELRDGVAWYNRRWNTRRYTKALGWRTPEKVVKDSYLKAALLMQIYAPKFLEKSSDRYQVKTTMAGKIVTKISKKKTKMLNHTERYLQFLKWDDDQNWGFVLLGISRNFSRSYRRARPMLPIVENVKGGIC